MKKLAVIISVVYGMGALLIIFGLFPYPLWSLGIICLMFILGICLILVAYAINKREMRQS